MAGLLIVNAHSVTDSSGEGFAVRLFRKGNQRGFVRAISDHPAAFAAGFNKVRARRPSGFQGHVGFQGESTFWVRMPDLGWLP